ncbi:TolB family protein [Chloroflexota bacterium]
MARRLIPLMLALLFLAACGPNAVVIPTVMDLESIVQTQAVSETASAAETAAAAPPTWTPSAVPSATLPPTMLASHTPSPVPEPGQIIFVVDGVLYSVGTDGSAFRPLTDALGVRDLALSPDRSMVIFVGQGSGSGQEIYGLDLTTDDLFQITALGYAEMHDPVWPSSGERLAFVAGQDAGGSREIYSIGLDGTGLEQNSDFAGSHPTLETTGLAGLVYTPDERGLIFAAPGLIALDLPTGALTPLTQASSFGNDASPTWRPDRLGIDELLYIRADNNQTEITGGPLHGFRLSEFTQANVPPVVAELFVQSFDVAADGQRAALSSAFGVYMLDFTSRTMREVAQTGVVLPQAAISPASQRVVYWRAGLEEDAVPQIVTAFYSGREVQVVLDNVAGAALGEILWVSEGD